MWWRLGVLFCVFCAGSRLLADDPPISADVIQSRLEAVDKSATLAKDAKATIRDLYQRASAALQTASKEAARSQQFSQMARTAPEDLGRARRRLSVLPESPELTSTADDSLNQLQERLTEREAELAQREAEFNQLNDEPKRRAARRRDILKPRAAVRAQLEDIQHQLDAAPPPDESPELTLAKRTHLLVQEQALQNALAAGASELDAYQATIDLLPLQVDLAAAHVALLQRNVKSLRATVKSRRRSEVNEHFVRAAKDVADFSDSEMLATRAKANLKLVERRKEVRERIDKTAHDLAALAQRAENLSQQRKRTEDKIDTVGLTGAIGLMLRQHKASLPEVSDYRRAVRQRQPELKDSQLAALELEERRADLADLDAALARVVMQIQANSGVLLSEVEQQEMRRLLAAERRYAGYLVADTNSYVEQLLELDGTQRQLIADVELFAQYVDERVLWVRNVDTLSAADVPVAFEVVRHFADIAPWRKLGGALLADLKSHLALYCLILALAAAACAAGWLVRAQRVRPPVEAERPNWFERVIPEVLEIVLCAVPWPLLIWFVGQRLSGVPSESGLVRAFGLGLTGLATSLLPLLIVRRMCRPRGFARRRLGWSQEGIRRIRAIVVVLILVALPLAFAHVVLSTQDNVRWQDSLGRICLLANLLVVALVVERVLRPRTGVLYRTLRPTQDGILTRLRWPLYVVGVGIHIGLATIAVAGFTYAADRLWQQVRATELLLFCLVVVGSLLTRWTRVNARRLATRRSREIRARETALVEQATELGLPQADTGDGWFVETEGSESKMRSLVTALLVLVGLIGLWYVWVDVIPALSVVNDIQMMPPLAPIKLGELLMAAFVLLSTFVVARHIAGVFELPVLHRLPLDSALRNTTTTVARYVLWIGAVIVAANFLGITWSKVQWMAAALSLGLGFGLQEIFANFISGLIILFERPMRVGDVITIGDTTGVVKAIRMRATTITDWDRKELVVPNKEFATGRLLNWTLTNKTNRRVIEVGVEYGTDPDLVRDLLLKVAQESPRVLESPKPIALFEKFADSALVFTLRVYHPKISDRLGGLHELNTAIQRELNQAGIKFAFPQRDLHLRTSAPPISWFGSQEESESEEDEANTQP